MTTLFDILNLKPETVQLGVAGVLGGLVRALTLRNGWGDALVAVVVGGICAIYGAPFVTVLWGSLLVGIGMPAESINGLSGFLAGIGGITFSGLLIDGWKWIIRKFFAKEEVVVASPVPTPPETPK